ncbi:MAG TPA: hypothetical protein VHG88_15335 [Burkholderiales bacterium]|nr:hypothetical protein [Burkholderiales bacterium]
MKDAIVTLEVVAVFAQAKEVDIAVRIGRATPHEDGWACPVELAPVYAQPMIVRGVDAFHATWLACSLVLKLLGQLKQEGAALRSPDGSEFPVDAYLAGLGDAAGG